MRARRVVEDVKSLTLIHVLEGIVAKIRLACMSVYSRRHLEFGLGKAVLVVGQAVGFGSLVAEGWLCDTGFSRWVEPPLTNLSYISSQADRFDSHSPSITY